MRIMEGYDLLSFSATPFTGPVDSEKLRIALNEKTGKRWKSKGQTREGDRTWFYFTFKNYLLIAVHSDGELATMLLERTDPKRKQSP